jgi:hypothetical protein
MVKLKTPFTRSKEMSQRRLEICFDCEHFSKRSYRCGMCGCFMNWKTLLSYEKCPLDKWLQEED